MSNEQVEKGRKRAKEWYRKNRDKVLKRIKAIASTKEHKLKKRKYDQEYRILNGEKITTRLSKWYLENRESQLNKARIWKQKNPIRAQFQRYQDNALLRGSKFGLPYEMFVEVVNMPCVYCGFNNGIVGIDRIDSSIGYLIDNIVPCCKICNFMKLNYSLEDWLSAMEKVFNNFDYEITQRTTGSN